MVLLSLAEAAMWMIQYDRATVVPNKMELVGFDIDYLMGLNTPGLARHLGSSPQPPAPKEIEPLAAELVRHATGTGVVTDFRPRASCTRFRSARTAITGAAR